MRPSKQLSLKAKELRRVIEPMITLIKKTSVANRRLAFNRCVTVTALPSFQRTGPLRFKARPGGTRILKMVSVRATNAPMAFTSNWLIVLRKLKIFGSC